MTDVHEFGFPVDPDVWASGRRSWRRGARSVAVCSTRASTRRRRSPPMLLATFAESTSTMCAEMPLPSSLIRSARATA